MSESAEEQMARARTVVEAAASVDHLLKDLPDLLRYVTRDDGVDTETLSSTLETTHLFLSSSLVQKTYSHAPDHLRGRQPINDSFLQNVASALGQIRGWLESQENLRLVDTSAHSMRVWISEALNRASKKEFAFLTVPEQASLDEYLTKIGDKLSTLEKGADLASATRRAKEAAIQAEASATKASSAAGSTADHAMSAFYRELAKEEQDSANLFRRWAIALGAVAGSLAWVFLAGAGAFGWLAIAPGDYVHLIQRLLVLTAFLALAGYLARQGHQHRTMANWARSLSVQLQTFDAFADAIETSEVRDDLRRTFAARVFGDHPAVKGEPAVSASAQALGQFTETLAKVAPSAK